MQPADRNADTEEYRRKQAVINEQRALGRSHRNLNRLQGWRCATLPLLVGFFERFQDIRHGYLLFCSRISFGAAASAAPLRRIIVCCPTVPSGMSPCES